MFSTDAIFSKYFWSVVYGILECRIYKYGGKTICSVNPPSIDFVEPTAA
jgi:hypothetical protein